MDAYILLRPFAILIGNHMLGIGFGKTDTAEDKMQCLARVSLPIANVTDVHAGTSDMIIRAPPLSLLFHHLVLLLLFTTH
jgi:hypothetical protein